MNRFVVKKKSGIRKWKEKKDLEIEMMGSMVKIYNECGNKIIRKM